MRGNPIAYILVYNSVVLWEATLSVLYSPYSVNVTATNELWEVNKTVISAEILFYDFFPYSVIVTNTKGGKFVYLQHVDTSLYRRESTF